MGKGACGVVKLAYEAKSCKPFAMKIIEKSQLTKNENDDINEVNIIKSLTHPCIIKMHDIVNETDSVFMFLDLMKGGDLLSRILKKKSKYLSENESKLIFLQICHAIKYLHDNNVTHRDLKPENILLQSDDDETLVKISDFGLSKFVKDNSVMKTLCGTPLYVAPEVLSTNGSGTYTQKIDIWSAGVVLFTMLSGSVPFSEEFGTPIRQQILKGMYAFRGKVWQLVSNSAKSLISQMLQKNPEKRLNIEEVLKHQWLNDIDIIDKAERLMEIKLLPVDNDDDENDFENFNDQQAKRRRID